MRSAPPRTAADVAQAVSSDAGARRAFCQGVATELGVQAGSVTVTRGAAGWVVVEVRVEAEDAARASSSASARSPRAVGRPPRTA